MVKLYAVIINTPKSQTCLLRLTPTALDYDRHGILLDDGANPGEGSEATVVSAAVRLQSIREEQVTVQTHGHPLVLLYVLKV